MDEEKKFAAEGAEEEKKTTEEAMQSLKENTAEEPVMNENQEEAEEAEQTENAGQEEEIDSLPQEESHDSADAETVETKQDITKKEEETEISFEKKAQNPAPAEQQEAGSHAAKMKWAVIAGIVAVVLIAAAVFLFGQTGSSDTAKTPLPLVYEKDGALYVYDTAGNITQYTDTMGEDSVHRYYYSAWGTHLGSEGNSMFYADHFTQEGMLQLNYAHQIGEEGTKIAENVYDFSANDENNVCAYLTSIGEGTDYLALWLYDGTETKQIAERIQPLEDCYTLSSDGKYLIYLLDGESGNYRLMVYDVEAGTSTEIANGSLAAYDISREDNTIYYVLDENNTYNFYACLPDGVGKMIASDISFMQLMPNGKEVLYCKQSDSTVLYKDLLYDDCPDDTSKDEVRALMTSDAGIKSILQACYLYTNGESKLLSESVISAAAMNSEISYALCYIMDLSETSSKVPISQVSSEDDILYYYYALAMQGTGVKLQILNRDGKAISLFGNDISSNGVQISKDGSMVAYFDTDEDGNQVLMCGELKGITLKNVQTVAENVDNAIFLGNSNTLAYLYDYVNNTGALGVYEDGKTTLLSDTVCHVAFASDKDEMFFIQNADETTGNGELMHYKNGTATHLDDNVFCIQYRNGGTAAYIKNYDQETQLGDLCYFDGSNTKEVDTQISALFIE